MSILLPVDAPLERRKEPWLLHVLYVNTMNFCSFALNVVGRAPGSDELLIAVPNTLSSETVSRRLYLSLFKP